MKSHLSTLHSVISLDFLDSVRACVIERSHEAFSIFFKQEHCDNVRIISHSESDDIARIIASGALDELRYGVLSHGVSSYSQDCRKA
jgi:hypothetical protein